MKLKTIIGIFLIIISIAAMFFWETTGRDMFTTTSVLVCRENIKKGQVVELSDFTVIKLDKHSVLEDSLTPVDGESLDGTIAVTDLVKNQQIFSSYFTKAGNTKAINQSIFVIPKEWIFSRSSALRAGDEISIYEMPQKEKLGTYKVAFVRDASEQEVTDLEPGAQTVLQRTDSGRTIAGIEIICTLDEYMKLYDCVTQRAEAYSETVVQPEQDTDKDESADFSDSDTELYDMEQKIFAKLLIVMEDAI